MFIQPSLQKTLIANTLFCKHRYVLENGSIAVYFGSFVHSKCASTDLCFHIFEIFSTVEDHTRAFWMTIKEYFSFFLIIQRNQFIYLIIFHRAFLKTLLCIQYSSFISDVVWFQKNSWKLNYSKMEQPTSVSNILTWDKLLKNEQLRLAQQVILANFRSSPN